MKRLCLAFLLHVVLLTFCYGQNSNSLSRNEKLYGLSKFWSECNYNFVYMYKVNKQQWDEAYRNALAEVVTTQSDYAYYRVLQKLCAVLKDGHTQVYFPEHIERQIMITQFGAYRLFFTNIQQRIYVSNVNRSKAEEIPVGSEVINVNGMPVQTYKETFVAPYIASSTQHNLDNKAAYNLLSGLDGDEFIVEFKTPTSALRTVTLRHETTAEQELALPMIQRENFEFKWLQDDVAYLAIRSFEDAALVDSFESNLVALQAAKGIVMDVRDNGGGSSRNALNIAKYFVKSDTIFGPKSYSREIIPTDRAIGSFLTAQDTIQGKSQWGLTKTETIDLYNAYLGSKFYAFPYQPIVVTSPFHFSVPVVLLTNNYTASAAEDFLLYLEKEANIVRVGEPTNGSTGQPLQIALPGNASAWICTKKVVKANGEEFVGLGIKPDVEVSADLRQVLYPITQDRQLKMAIKQLR